MTDARDSKPYLDIHELVARTGYSAATIWRLKKAGKIPFYQPGGKGGRVTFPPDAIEAACLTKGPNLPEASDTPASERLPGPRPRWMSPSQNNNKNGQQP